MAKFTDDPATILKTEFEWGIVYRGKKAALIAEKIAKAHWFPTLEERRPGPSARIVRRKTLDGRGFRGRSVRTQHEPGTDTYAVVIGYSKAEMQARGNNKPAPPPEPPKKNRVQRVEFDYGSRKVVVKMCIDPAYVYTEFTKHRIPVAYDAGKPVYYDWNRDGRYIEATDNAVIFRRGYSVRKLPYSIVER
jgi:hypothetical protein